MAGYVSEAVIRRMPSYYRHLKALEAEGIQQISSQELAERMKLTASQIRQDINCIGGIGRQGFGYPVRELKEHIRKIMGMNDEHRLVILGAGRIGCALADYSKHSCDGFTTVGLFDEDPDKLCWEENLGIPVYDTREMEIRIKELRANIAVLAVPAGAAQQLLDRAYACGIRAFMNFALEELHCPSDAMIVNVNLCDNLFILGLRMKLNEK